MRPEFSCGTNWSLHNPCYIIWIIRLFQWSINHNWITFSEEDKVKKEKVDARNNGESTIYAADKLINENGDKISEDNKSQINEIKDKLSAQLNSEEENAEEITNLTNELQSKMQEIGQDIYSQAPPENNENNEDNDDSDTIEGEYKEV